MNRRQFLATSAATSAASAALLPSIARAAASAPLIKGQAEHVISIWLGGGMSQIDTFDPKRRGDPAKKLAGSYYESIDMDDARHEQTLLAYELNGEALPIKNGAPLRLRVERQLGYKMAKYILRIELVDALAGIGDGQGGYWEDQGYQWYAGI